MANDKDIFGYKCPICKMLNPKAVKYCVQCGHWLLDQHFPGEPLDKESYLKLIKASKSHKHFNIKKFFIGAAIVLVFLFIIGNLLSNQPDQQKPSEITFEEFKITAINIEYDELARNTEQHKNTRVHLIGKVIQVVDTPPILRIDVAKTTPSNSFPNSKIIWVTRKDSTGRVLENDTVEVWGTVKGPKTYKSVLRQQITIPEVESKYLKITQKAGEK